jgi:hypothetical protein
VTIPIVVSETHFQNTTSSALTCDLTFCFVSILKICRVRPAGMHARAMDVVGQIEQQRDCLKVGGNRSPQDIIGVREINNDYFVFVR